MPTEETKQEEMKLFSELGLSTIVPERTQKPEGVAESYGPVPMYLYWDSFHGAWTSPNATVLPNIPEWDENKVHKPTRHRNVSTPFWLSNRFPHIAFWPRRPRFEGPIFSRLDVTYETIQCAQAPSYREDYAFSRMFNKSDKDSWSKLEDALIDLVYFLLGRAFKAPTELATIRVPSDFGYKNHFRDEDRARKAVLQSKDAFIGLTSLLTFAIAANMTHADSSQLVPKWAQDAISLRGVHPQWIQDLLDSFVCDFTPGFRPGALVPAYISSWGKAFSAFIFANAPLWVIWGREKHRVADKRYMSVYSPDNEGVKRAQSSPGIGIRNSHFKYDVPISFYPWRSESARSISTSTPTVYPGSQQHEMETHDEFTTRMNCYAQERVIYESEEERKEREERISISEEDRVNYTLKRPTQGQAIFEWVQVDANRVVRKPVSEIDWRSKWTATPHNYRHYWSHLNEWDLDTYRLHEQPQYANRRGTPESPYIPYNYTELDPIESSPDPSYPQHPLPSSSSQLSFSSEPQNIHNEEAQQTFGDLVQTQEKRQTPSLISILQNRYGFLVDEADYSTDITMTHYTPNSSNTDVLERALRIIGEWTNPAPPTVQAAAKDLYNFVVARFKDQCLTKLPHLGDYDALKVFNHPILNYCQSNGKEPLHLIGIQGEPMTNQWYLLALREPTTVLQVFRENRVESESDKKIGILSIIRSLISRGIPFNTVKTAQRKPTHTPIHKPYNRIGIRSFNHKFSTVDYQSYERIKKDLLKMSIIGRHALMKGGIVWRLAIEIVNPKTVTEGPSSSCRREGTVHGILNGQFLVDDTVNDGYEDIICGVYTVYTGKHNQTVHLSWWPKNNTWAQGGLNVGYWSSDCELWFQRRLAAIRDGIAQPYGASEWRNKLKLKVTSTATFVNSIHLLADRALADGALAS